MLHYHTSCPNEPPTMEIKQIEYLVSHLSMFIKTVLTISAYVTLL